MNYLDRKLWYASRHEEGRDDTGLTLVELVVSMLILSIFLTVALVVVRSGSSAAQTTLTSQELNEEARHALNRMARDIRQADEIVHVINPGQAPLADAVVAIRFVGDYTGDGCIEDAGQACAAVHDPSNPEDLTYCFDPDLGQILVVDNVQPAGVPTIPRSQAPTTCTGGQPLLAGNVGSLQITPTAGSQWTLDSDHDGVTSWEELDAGSVGNNNNSLDVETPYIDSVVLSMTMELDGLVREYQTSVDLRNVGE